MNWSDDKVKKDKTETTQRLESLGYHFPDTSSVVIEQFKFLPYETLLSLRNEIRSKSAEFLSSANRYIDSAIESDCEVCDRSDHGYDDLPMDWGWIKTNTRYYLVCDRCQFRWAEMFDELPKVERTI